MLEVPLLGGIDGALQADEDVIPTAQGGDGVVVQFGIEAHQGGFVTVGDAIDAVGGELSDGFAGVVELETVFQHHLVEDVGFVEQRIEGRFLVGNVLPEQGDVLLAGFLRVGLELNTGEVALDQAIDLEAGLVRLLPLLEQALLLLFGLLLRDAGDDPFVALDGDVGDFLVAGFAGFGFFVGQFGDLDEDELAVAVVFFVQVHDGVARGPGACKEVED